MWMVGFAREDMNYALKMIAENRVIHNSITSPNPHEFSWSDGGNLFEKMALCVLDLLMEKYVEMAEDGVLFLTEKGRGKLGMA